MSCIKSIQRGIGDADTTSFIINKVNPDKCLVLIDGIVTSSASSYQAYIPGLAVNQTNYYASVYGGATLASIEATTLAFSNVKNAFSWQVIEFA